MERDIAHGINIVRHKYSNDPNFKGNHSSYNFLKNAHVQDIVFPRALRNGLQNQWKNLIFKIKPLIKQ